MSPSQLSNKDEWSKNKKATPSTQIPDEMVLALIADETAEAQDREAAEAQRLLRYRLVETGYSRGYKQGHRDGREEGLDEGKGKAVEFLTAKIQEIIGEESEEE